MSQDWFEWGFLLWNFTVLKRSPSNRNHLPPDLCSAKLKIRHKPQICAKTFQIYIWFHTGTPLYHVIFTFMTSTRPGHVFFFQVHLGKFPGFHLDLGHLRHRLEPIHWDPHRVYPEPLFPGFYLWISLDTLRRYLLFVTFYDPISRCQIGVKLDDMCPLFSDFLTPFTLLMALSIVKQMALCDANWCHCSLALPLLIELY